MQRLTRVSKLIHQIPNTHVSLNRTGSNLSAHIHTSTTLFHPSKSPPSFSKYESNGFPHKTLDQGHVLDTRSFSPDPHSAAARSGFAARHTLGFEHPHDAASPRRGTRFKMSEEERARSGNRECVGFVDQVGGQSAAVEVFERNGFGAGKGKGEDGKS